MARAKCVVCGAVLGLYPESPLCMPCQVKVWAKEAADDMRGEDGSAEVRWAGPENDGDSPEDMTADAAAALRRLLARLDA